MNIVAQAGRDIDISSATDAARRSAERARTLTRHSAALQEKAVRSLQHSARLSEELAQRAARLGLTDTASGARANAARARRAARTRLAFTD